MKCSCKFERCENSVKCISVYRVYRVKGGKVTPRWATTPLCVT